MVRRILGAYGEDAKLESDAVSSKALWFTEHTARCRDA